jgi:hypothetical protein
MPCTPSASEMVTADPVVDAANDEQGPGADQVHIPEQQWELHAGNIPDLEQVPPMKNFESLLIFDDYPEKDVKTFTVKYCPCWKTCSTDAWKRSSCWSLQGMESCLSYVMWHLTKSSKHCMSVEEAHMIITETVLTDDLKWEVEAYDWQSREYYRKDHLRKEQKRQREADKGKGNGGKGTKRFCSRSQEPSSSSNDEAVRLTPAMVQAMVTEGIAKARDKLKQAGVEEDKDLELEMSLDESGETIVIPIERLRLIQDSLTRAEHSVSSALINCAMTSKKLDADRMMLLNCIKLISTFTGDDVRTMSSARGQLSIGS